jgi:hypothetical protein
MSLRAVAVGCVALLSLTSCQQKLPTCAAGQVVTSDGTNLNCVSQTAALSVPDCPSGQVLTGTSSGLSCAVISNGNMVTIPTCQAGDVLTASNNAFSCVRPITVPTCDASSVLTNDGTALKCVAQVMAPTVPNCSSSEALSKDSTGYRCVTIPTVPAPPTCAAGKVLTSDGTTLSCVDQPVVPTPPACGASQVLTSMGGALACVNTLAVPTCTSGQVLTGNGTSLSCVTPVSFPTCTSGQFLSFNGTALSCGGVPPARPTYLGNTTTTSNGRITRTGTPVGIESANGLCSDQYGAGAHMCTIDEMVGAYGTGGITATTTTARAWVLNFTTVDTTSFATSNYGYSLNCASYTYGTGDHPWGGTSGEWSINSATGLRSFQFRWGVSSGNGTPCNVTLPTACCR